MRIDSERVLAGPVLVPARARVPLAVVAAGAATVVVLLGFLFAGDLTGTGFDRWAERTLEYPGSPWAQIAMVVDWLAEPVGAVFFVGGAVSLCLRRGHRRAALLVVLGTGLSVLATTGLKPVVGRDINNGFLAFPSGHTATMTAVTLSVLLAFRVRSTVLALAVTTVTAAVMGWSQVALNSHYATDTAGGFLTGLAVVAATALAIDRLAAAPRLTT